MNRGGAAGDRLAQVHKDQLEAAKAAHHEQLVSQIETSKKERSDAAGRIASLAAELQRARGKDDEKATLEAKLNSAEAVLGEAKARVATLECAEVDLGKALAAADRSQKEADDARDRSGNRASSRGTREKRVERGSGARRRGPK